MTRKSIITIVVGLLILAITFAIFNAMFNATAPSEAEVNAVVASGGSPQMLIEKSQQAQGVQTLFYFIAASEVMATGLLAYQWRQKK